MVSQLDLTLRIADYWVRPAPCQSVLCLRNQALCNPMHMVLPVRCSPNAAGRARAFVQDLNANSYRIENSDGHAWALVHLGETVTDTCCGKPCFTIPVHSQTLVCAQELEVQARNTYIRRDHASIPGESASNAWHVDKSIPVTVIPWGGMNIGQHGASLSSIRQD